MMKLNRVLCVAAFAIGVAPAAHAQVTIDVAKITCEQFLLFKVTDPRDISMWLSGYYNGKLNNTVLDTQKFKDHADQVKNHCRSHMNMSVMDAARSVLGLTN